MLHQTVVLEAEMEEVAAYGGIAIQHTGTGWANSTLLQSLNAIWE